MVTPLCEIGNKLSKGRIVSSLEWNPKAEDTFLVGFTESDTFYNKTGLVQIWTLNKSSPEYTINSPSQITTSVFDPIQPKIIYCGTATGQILQYDTRTKPIPVNSTPIDISTSSLKSDKTNLFDHSSQRMPENFVIHSYLITNIGVVVEDNNSYILSFSGDGVICKWNSLDLTKPNIRKELLNTKNENQKLTSKEDKQILLCSKSISPNNKDKIILASDDGNVYETIIDENEENDLGNINKIYEGNMYPINSIEYHPYINEFNYNFSDLFLTGSSDWTASLWSDSDNSHPLLTLDVCNDSIYSTSWHTVNPSVFVTGDGSGCINFWDLNKDLCSPIYELQLEDYPVISKIVWTQDGKKMAIGKNDGKVSIYTARNELLNVKDDDYRKFKSIIEELKFKNIN